MGKPDFDPNNCTDEQKSLLRIDGNEISTTSENITWIYKHGKWLQQIQSKTAIYIENIPKDATIMELQTYFKKCGIIMVDDHDLPKIKLFGKNDAMITFLKEASVDLAIQLYDETSLRGEGQLMNISRAMILDYGKPKDSKSKKTRNKQPTMSKRQKLEKKLEWFEMETSKKHLKTVVLRHMFNPVDFEKDPALLIDIKDDVRTEAEKVGQVNRIVMYDLHPEGIICIKYQDELAAQACVELMNGRIFDGLKVAASIYDGKENFKSFQSRQNEIDNFGDFVEEEEEAKD
eukprot:NODE_116_length_19003_cov_0.233707.p6 type:complete len:289 gc:universal NODE_116_length_19003_cov_0.233707:7934-7068(-)